MKTKIINLWILLLIPMYTFAQKEYVNKMNQFNARGEKNGCWIENRGSDSTELYYKDGKRNGVFKSYSKQGTLSILGEYLEGNMTGTWFYFGDKGHLVSTQKDFMINKDAIVLDTGKRYIFPYRCYSICYYPNGVMEKEGVLLWNTDPEMDDVREYGEWKYYNEMGELVKAELYK